MNTIKDKITFGQYRGLSIQETYQGTLNISKTLIANYLDEILNNPPEYEPGFFEMQLIERFEVTNQRIKIIGQIYDETKPLNDSNRVLFRNLEKEISGYVNCFW